MGVWQLLRVPDAALLEVGGIVDPVTTLRERFDRRVEWHWRNRRIGWPLMISNTAPTRPPGRLTGFNQALLVQIRVIGALVLREMRVRYGRTQFGYVWALLEPIAYIAAITVIFTYLDRPPPFGSSMPLFFALGIIPFRLFNSIANQLTAAMQANLALLTYPIVREFDTVLARFILEVMTGLTVFILCVMGLYVYYELPWPSHPMRIIEGFMLICLLGFGIGLTNACIMRKFASWQNIFRMIMAPMIFLSGVFYSLASLPSEVRAIIAWNPVIHGIEIIRDGYYAHYRVVDLSEGYLLACGLGLTVIGMFAERFYRLR
ncbi:MAG: ABC transporter permease [Alphaproteobacteria bacterium]|nr:ABC transporter permease [Alphaproteobacteria bacterium]